MTPISIIRAIKDQNLLGHAYREPETFAPWFTVFKTLFGLPFNEDDLERFQTHTGRRMPSPAGYQAAYLICGRRAGKSRALATIAVYLACFRDWQSYLAPGEKAHVMLLARDRSQAKSIFNFIAGLLTESPMLSSLVVNQTADSIELEGRVVIEVHSSNYGAVRGRTVIAALSRLPPRLNFKT